MHSLPGSSPGALGGPGATAFRQPRNRHLRAGRTKKMERTGTLTGTAAELEFRALGRRRAPGPGPVSLLARRRLCLGLPLYRSLNNLAPQYRNPLVDDM